MVTLKVFKTEVKIVKITGICDCGGKLEDVEGVLLSIDDDPISISI